MGVDEREGLLGQVGKGDGAGLGERVPFADGQHRALFADDVAAHAVHGLRAESERDLQLARGHQPTSTPVLSCLACTRSAGRSSASCASTACAT